MVQGFHIAHTCAMAIHWYPGHMHKAIREMNKILADVDLVIELLDARLPSSSQNPVIEKLRLFCIRLEGAFRFYARAVNKLLPLLPPLSILIKAIKFGIFALIIRLSSFLLHHYLCKLRLKLCKTLLWFLL